MRVDNSGPARARPRWWLHLAIVAGVVCALGPAAPAPSAAEPGWSPFASFFDSANFSTIEQVGLAFALIVSLFALGYAWFLGKHVSAAEKGTAFRKCARKDLDWVFSIQTERTVAHDNTVVLQNRYLQLGKTRVFEIRWPVAP